MPRVRAVSASPAGQFLTAAQQGAVQGDTPGSASNGPSEAHGAAEAWATMRSKQLGELAIQKGIRCQKTVNGKWKMLTHPERLQAFTACHASPETSEATVDPASGKSQAYEEMSKEELRELAKNTPGMKRTKTST